MENPPVMTPAERFVKEEMFSPVTRLKAGEVEVREDKSFSPEEILEVVQMVEGAAEKRRDVATIKQYRDENDRLVYWDFTVGELDDMGAEVGYTFFIQGNLGGPIGCSDVSYLAKTWTSGGKVEFSTEVAKYLSLKEGEEKKWVKL